MTQLSVVIPVYTEAATIEPLLWEVTRALPEVSKQLVLTSNDFGIDIEISAQVALRRWQVYDVAISYYGGTYEEGKKINWQDGVKALFYLIKFRTGGFPLRSHWFTKES